MKKLTKTIVFLLVFLCAVTLTSCKKETKVEESFPELVSKLKSYKLVGKLESMFPSGTKECEISVYYKQPNLYRVELKNAGNNEPQIMIKNNEGIYVLLPAVNKIFKINSNWPNNSSYPYILQSLSKDIIGDDNLLINKDKNNTTLEFKAKQFNNAMVTKQKVTFDNETKMPQEVLIYDDQDTLLVRFKVDKIDTNIEVDDKYFKVNDSMSTARLTYASSPIDFERLITYPTYYPEKTTLQQENTMGNGGTKRVIMKYSGESPFTIIEQYVINTEQIKTEYVSGDIYTMGGAICILANNTIQFYDSGIEYTVASTSLDYYTMIHVGESLRTADLK